MRSNQYLTPDFKTGGFLRCFFFHQQSSIDRSWFPFGFCVAIYRQELEARFDFCCLEGGFFKIQLTKWRRTNFIQQNHATFKND